MRQKGGLILPLIKTEFLDLASVADISADKAITIGRRAVWRDYVDFFVLLKGKYYGISEIINFAKKKFKGEFNEALFLQQLTYFKDVEEAPVEFIGKSYSASEIKLSLEKEVQSLVSKL
ncbi:hypothetical protein COT44_02015 [Candidatus Shapirobacteria bacterium CG08_land_8_20_14_0_20_39_18]|uniref:Uncharacterized protein n=1 Tax=Candidatus Shapirobacteria bacterium CG08_land_8_20_14_0_20_39_18 TaxID=1974883 RepID=A0A2M6XD87_9BACT|nr:MAG: hypothetical protein COT44_02015 [Candidatus Shapirobacteria bacterium CG08_land_8_20_14_0_20_39_18]PIY66016.1 MAG: hypothetical protein COY91_00915 [Candidatus Shapirobacteria bacterium CG_4_10_14_0_8_um_filter_39_15]PJE68216.1 MAG: hypothetical protein COU94_03085 [Candidatus Shapirobacteria bacterium CG10_big_fil_rev_8_21_14_0_10_38_8]